MLRKVPKQIYKLNGEEISFANFNAELNKRISLEIYDENKRNFEITSENNRELHIHEYCD